MNWFLIGLAVFIAFQCLMTFALCRAARLGDEMAARMANRHDDARQHEEDRP